MDDRSQARARDEGKVVDDLRWLDLILAPMLAIGAFLFKRDGELRKTVQNQDTQIQLLAQACNDLKRLAQEDIQAHEKLYERVHKLQEEHHAATVAVHSQLGQIHGLLADRLGRA